MAVAWFVSGLPGHVSATVSGVSVEASAPVAIAALAGFVLAVHLLLRLLAGLPRLPRRLGGWTARRRRCRGDAGGDPQALVALAAGEASDARREAARARRLLGDTPQTLLLAAEAAPAGRATSPRPRQITTPWPRARMPPSSACAGCSARRWRARTGLPPPRSPSAPRRRDPGGSWLRDERAQLAVRTGDWAQALALAGADAPVAASPPRRPRPRATRRRRSGSPAGLEGRSRPDAGRAGLCAAAARGGRESARAGGDPQAWAALPHPDLAAFALAPLTDRWRG